MEIGKERGRKGEERERRKRERKELGKGVWECGFRSSSLVSASVAVTYVDLPALFARPARSPLPFARSRIFTSTSAACFGAMLTNIISNTISGILQACFLAASLSTA